jgi:hypothetical protein
MTIVGDKIINTKRRAYYDFYTINYDRKQDEKAIRGKRKLAGL